jgi:aminoglycoside 3-N-acetyltransferase
VFEAKLVEEVAHLGVQRGGVLLVHASFRALRPIEGGPLGMIRALRTALGPEGTLVMPTMTDGSTIFDPHTTPTDGMGIIAELFWRQPGVLRSTHPGGSFAAEGPSAKRICAPQPLSPPHGPDSPVGRVHDLDGQVLLLGVTHSENTTLHLAEAVAKVPYSILHPCVVEQDGTARTVMVAETDHCCRGFRVADNWLRSAGLQREGKIGNAHARLCRSRDLVDAAVHRLRVDPLTLLCPRTEDCQECAAAYASIGVSPGS